MNFFLLLAFALQGLAMFFDEFYYHRKRGLGRWERIGHPADTLFVLACYLFVVFAVPSASNISIFIGLCSFSCLFITKDEFEHKKYCCAQENWLHAILFILHPISFFSLGVIWLLKHHFSFELNQTFADSPLLYSSIYIQITVVSAFIIYQIIYWSFIWKPKKS